MDSALHSEIAALREEVQTLQAKLAFYEEREASTQWPREWHLEPAEAKLLKAIYEAAPKTLSIDGCFMAMWPNGEEPEWARTSLGVRLTKLRRKLKPLGVTIITRTRLGYAISSEHKSLLAKLAGAE